MKGDLELMVEVASMYYISGLSQKEIASKLFFSRSKVSRLLQEAINQNIVKIQINYPNQRVPLLENKIHSHYNLKNIMVLRSMEVNDDVSLRRFSDFAAKQIEPMFKDNMRIGISSGKTLRYIIESLEDLHSTGTILYQVKGMSNQEHSQSNDCPQLIRMLETKLKSKSYELLYAPLYVENRTVKNYIINEQLIKNTMKSLSNLDMILSTTTTFSKKRASIWSDFLENEDYQTLLSKGAVAGFLGHILNKDGQIVSQSTEDKLIGISLKQLENCKNVILVAAGEDKAASVKAVLNSGVINTLIIDSSLAKKLLITK